MVVTAARRPTPAHGVPGTERKRQQGFGTDVEGQASVLPSLSQITQIPQMTLGT